MTKQLDREMDAVLADLNANLQQDFPDARLHHRPDKTPDTATSRIDATIKLLESQIEALLTIRRRL